MKTLKISLITLTAALFVAACSQTRTSNPGSSNNALDAKISVAAAVETKPQPSATLDELAAAHGIYSESCVKCHKENGLGGISEIDGRKIKAPNFTSARMIKDDDAEWIEAIENGIPEDGMPAYQDILSEQEIKDLVKMIRRDFQGK